MKSSSTVFVSVVGATLSVSPFVLAGCGSSSTPGGSASGGAAGAMTSGFGGSAYLGAGGSVFTGAGGSGTLATGTQPTTCRLDSACATVGSTCQAMCPAVNGVTSTLQYTCTCGMRGAGATGTDTGTATGTRTGFGTGTGTGVGTSTRTGTGTGTGNLIYTTCNEATACVPACAGGAQTAGSTCTAADNTCTYTNASGAAVTCTCGGAGGARLWTCR